MKNLPFLTTCLVLGLTNHLASAHWAENHIFGPTCGGIPVEYGNVPEFHPIVSACDREPNFCRPLCILSKLGVIDDRGLVLEGRATSVLQALLPGRLHKKACELSGAFKACWAATNFNEPQTMANGCASYSSLLNCFRKSTLMICENIRGRDLWREAANTPWPSAFIPRNLPAIEQRIPVKNAIIPPQPGQIGNGFGYNSGPQNINEIGYRPNPNVPVLNPNPNPGQGLATYNKPPVQSIQTIPQGRGFTPQNPYGLNYRQIQSIPPQNRIISPQIRPVQPIQQQIRPVQPIPQQIGPIQPIPQQIRPISPQIQPIPQQISPQIQPIPNGQNQLYVQNSAPRPPLDPRYYGMQRSLTVNPGPQSYGPGPIRPQSQIPMQTLSYQNPGLNRPLPQNTLQGQYSNPNPVGGFQPKTTFPNNYNGFRPQVQPNIQPPQNLGRGFQTYQTAPISSLSRPQQINPGNGGYGANFRPQNNPGVGYNYNFPQQQRPGPPFQPQLQPGSYINANRPQNYGGIRPPQPTYGNNVPNNRPPPGIPQQQGRNFQGQYIVQGQGQGQGQGPGMPNNPNLNYQNPGGPMQQSPPNNPGNGPFKNTGPPINAGQGSQGQNQNQNQGPKPNGGPQGSITYFEQREPAQPQQAQNPKPNEGSPGSITYFEQREPPKAPQGQAPNPQPNEGPQRITYFEQKEPQTPQNPNIPKPNDGPPPPRKLTFIEHERAPEPQGPGPQNPNQGPQNPPQMPQNPPQNPNQGPGPRKLTFIEHEAAPKIPEPQAPRPQQTPNPPKEPNPQGRRVTFIEHEAGPEHPQANQGQGQGQNQPQGRSMNQNGNSNNNHPNNEGPRNNPQNDQNPNQNRPNNPPQQPQPHPADVERVVAQAKQLQISDGIAAIAKAHLALRDNEEKQKQMKQKQNENNSKGPSGHPALAGNSVRITDTSSEQHPHHPSKSKGHAKGHGSN